MVHKLYAGSGTETPATGDSGLPKASAEALLDVVSQLSHDIRTPLGAIMGFTDLLLDGAGGPLTPEQRRHLRQIRRSGDRILAIVKDCVKHAKEGPVEP